MNSFKRNSTFATSGIKSSTTNWWWMTLLLFASMAGAGCTGSKGLAKRGVQMEQAGLYNDAANFYYNALLRNRNNVDARIGLTNTSRRVLNDKLDAFSRHRAMEEHQKAYHAWDDAMKYHERIRRVGIDHDIPSHMTEDFEQSKSILLRELYQNGSDLMAERRFDEAKAVFLKVASIDPNYKDITELKAIARNEPLYAKAIEHFDAGRYRNAFYELDQIYQTDKNYRDVAILRQECLNLGRYPVALSPVKNASGVANVESRVHAYLITSLSQVNDPFLRIVERDNMDVILAEQRLSLSGIVDESTATRVGNLLGAKALINATVLSHSTQPGRLNRTPKDGFESYTVKLVNSETNQPYYETRHRPVKYNEFYQRNEVRLSVQYQAISLESGEVLFSRVVERMEEDQMYYAAYDGEVNNLIPAGPNGELGANRDRQRLQNLIRAPRTFKSIDELTTSAFHAVANDLATDLTNFLKRP